MRYKILLLLVIICNLKADPIIIRAPLFTVANGDDIIKIQLTGSNYVAELNGAKTSHTDLSIITSIFNANTNVEKARDISLERLNENILLKFKNNQVQSFVVAQWLFFEKNKKDNWNLKYSDVAGKKVSIEIEDSKILILLEKIENIRANKQKYKQLWSEFSFMWRKE